MGCHVLPHTPGVHSADKFVTLAQMAPNILNTKWIKREAIGDDHTRQPHLIAALNVATRLACDGFWVFAKTHMPW